MAAIRDSWCQKDAQGSASLQILDFPQIRMASFLRLRAEEWDELVLTSGAFGDPFHQILVLPNLYGVDNNVAESIGILDSLQDIIGFDSTTGARLAVRKEKNRIDLWIS